jgi:hypothetical protein
MTGSFDYEELRAAATRVLGGPPLTTAQTDQLETALATFGRMAETWTLRDPTAWIEELVQLDLARANTALVRLRHEIDGTITIPKFFEAYRRVVATRASDAGATACEHCGNSGWVRASGRVHPDGRGSSAVTACDRCDSGVAARRTQLWIIQGGLS